MRLDLYKSIEAKIQEQESGSCLKKEKLLEKLAELSFKSSLVITVSSLFLIIIYIFCSSLPLFSHFGFFDSLISQEENSNTFVFKRLSPEKISLAEFLFSQEWDPRPTNGKFGILPMIIASFYTTFLAVLISTPIGIGCAIFSTELASGKIRELIKLAIQILAGTPSVVYGYVGLSLLVPFLQRSSTVSSGFCILAASLVLSLMILPTIIGISQDVIQAVPKDLKRASLALGSTNYQAIIKITLPVASPGLVMAIVLSVSRAFGEAMAVKMVLGNIQSMPNFTKDYWFGLLSAARTLTTNIIVDIDYAEGSHLSALFATGSVLLVIVMGVNYLAHGILKRFYGRTLKN